MERDHLRLLITFSFVFAIIGWLALMVSFWLPGVAGEALKATALSMILPGAVIGVIGWACEEELTELHRKRQRGIQRTHPLRCSDCGTKILNAGGVTVGDAIEEEIAMDALPHRDSRGNWIPPGRND